MSYLDKNRSDEEPAAQEGRSADGLFKLINGIHDYALKAAKAGDVQALDVIETILRCMAEHVRTNMLGGNPAVLEFNCPENLRSPENSTKLTRKERDREVLIQVGMRIRAARDAMGLTQTELANALDLSHPYICQIEAGFKNIRLDLADKICDALDIHLESDLLKRERLPTSAPIRRVAPLKRNPMRTPRRPYRRVVDPNSKGGKIRAARINAGFTQSELGEKAGFCCSYVSQLEHGEKACAESLAKLEECLGIDLNS